MPRQTLFSLVGSRIFLQVAKESALWVVKYHCSALSSNRPEKYYFNNHNKLNKKAESCNVWKFENFAWTSCACFDWVITMQQFKQEPKTDIVSRLSTTVSSVVKQSKCLRLRLGPMSKDKYKNRPAKQWTLTYSVRLLKHLKTRPGEMVSSVKHWRSRHSNLSAMEHCSKPYGGVLTRCCQACLPTNVQAAISPFKSVAH